MGVAHGVVGSNVEETRVKRSVVVDYQHVRFCDFAIMQFCNFCNFHSICIFIFNVTLIPSSVPLHSLKCINTSNSACFHLYTLSPTYQSPSLVCCT